MNKLDILDINGKKADNIDLPEELTKGRINKDVLQQVVVMYGANKRQGNASTKVRGDVSGGGVKPFRQKGTGRARAGSSRSPLWIGGGVVFGPHPRDFSYTLPRQIKKVALRESLKAKITGDKLCCINEVKQSFSKTKEFKKVLDVLKLQGKTLALLDGSDESIHRVSKNIAFFQLMRADDVNAYDILRNKSLLVTKTALKKLLDRVKK